jgi:hypothetical protein
MAARPKSMTLTMPPRISQFVGLPVPVGGREGRGRRRPRLDLRSQPPHHRRSDAVWSAEPRQRLLVLAHFVVVVRGCRLGVEQGQQFARLLEGGRIVTAVAPVLMGRAPAQGR